MSVQNFAEYLKIALVFIFHQCFKNMITLASTFDDANKNIITVK